MFRFYYKILDLLLLYLTGFTGKLCETNIGNCLSQPCGSLSLCKDELDGYRCFCAPGFIGESESKFILNSFFLINTDVLICFLGTFFHRNGPICTN